MWLGQEPDPRPWGMQDETRASEGAALLAPWEMKSLPRGGHVRTSPGVDPAWWCWNQREPSHPRPGARACGACLASRRESEPGAGLGWQGRPVITLARLHDREAEVPGSRADGRAFLCGDGSPARRWRLL